MGKAALFVTFFALTAHGVQSAAAGMEFKHFYIYRSAQLVKLTENKVDGQTVSTVDFLTSAKQPLSMTLCRETSRETLKDLPKNLFTLQVIETINDDQSESSCITDAYVER